MIKREDLVTWERDLRALVRRYDAETAHDVANAIEVALIEWDREELRKADFERAASSLGGESVVPGCCYSDPLSDCPVHGARP